MKLVCELRDYRGDKESLICVIDPKSEDCFFPGEPRYNLNLDRLLDGTLLAIYECKEAAYEPEVLS